MTIPLSQPMDRLSHIPIANIHIVPGFNPRRFFADAASRELVQSIKSAGVIQPVVVRPGDEEGQYLLIADERRWRAAQEAGLDSLPGVIRDVDEAGATLLAVIENSQRDDISPAEEAQAARRVLTAAGNDRPEAARLLGWSAAKLDARLLLLHCSGKVLEALTERRVKLGHAELLSQLPEAMQDATLEKILAEGHTVADLKRKLEGFARELKNAVFDLGGCALCPHNSDVQGSLFEETIAGGRCAHPACFNQKTAEALAARKESLREHYPAVFLDTERAPGTYAVLCQQGPSGVGKAQYAACQQCGNFGALLISNPSRPGTLQNDLCFDLACHKQKVAAHLAETSPPPAAKSTTPAAPKATGPAKAAADRPKGDAPKANPAVLPGKVTENIQAFYRGMAAKVAPAHQRSLLLTNTFALWRLAGQPRDLLPGAMPEGKPTGSLHGLAEFAAALHPLDAKALGDLNRRLLAHVLGELDKGQPTSHAEWARGAARVAVQTGAPLADHFRLDRDFLAAFTKSGMEGVLREAVNAQGESFVDFYTAHKKGDKKAFPALMKRKTGDILDEAFGCGYDFAGFVPTCVAGYADAKPRPTPAAACA